MYTILLWTSYGIKYSIESKEFLDGMVIHTYKLYVQFFIVMMAKAIPFCRGLSEKHRFGLAGFLEVRGSRKDSFPIVL